MTAKIWQIQKRGEYVSHFLENVPITWSHDFPLFTFAFFSARGHFVHRYISYKSSTYGKKPKAKVLPKWLNKSFV